MTEAAHPFWAHSPDNDAGVPPQLLRDHLLAVAEISARNGEYFEVSGIETMLRAVGLIHDLGKFRLTFQHDRLGYDPISGHTDLPRHRGVDHSGLGASLLYIDDGDEPSPVSKLRNLLAHAVAAHHAGLYDQSDLRLRIQDALRADDRQQSLSFATGELVELPAAMNDLAQLKVQMSMLSVDVLTRMVLSCLVDADRTDSEAHGSPARASLRQRSTQPLRVLADRLQVRRLTFPTVGKVNMARRAMYEQVMERVGLEPGFFRLTMPTGGGKTLTSLEFSLVHAVQHGLRRVIYAIPYTSIIEQTAMVFRSVLNEPGEENVLEHHSAVEPKQDDPYETTLWRTLLSESWDAPVIVTTTVQLFESLFASRTGRLRKLHNVAGSVIVLDEAQTLPTRLLGPILNVLSELVERYRVSVVFCTATQPAFNASAGFEFPGLEHARELVPNNTRYFTELKRVEYEVDVERTTPWNRVAERMADHPQVLAIVNLRKDARELYELVRTQDPAVLHLSTNMYPVHRRQVLQEIRARLAAGNPCRVVSTQLIECGVDVDFPTVFRAIGPLDSIVQAAGRCNREGALTDAVGRPVRGTVWVFRPEGEVAPKGDYLIKVVEASAMLADDVDLASPDIFEAFFHNVFQHADSQNLELQALRERQQFASVAANFKFIDADTLPVVITWRDAGEERTMLQDPLDLLAKLRSGGVAATSDVWRQLQMFAVGLRPSQIAAASQQLQRVQVMGSQDLDLFEWMGHYSEATGLELRGDVERYIV